MNKTLFVLCIIGSCFASPKAEVTVISDTRTQCIFEIDLPIPQLETIRTPEGNFTRINLDGADFQGMQGMPELPMFQYSVGIPAGSYSLTYTSAGLVSLPLSYPIIPSPTLGPQENSSLVGYRYLPDKTVYSASRLPAAAAVTGSVNYMGSQRILTIAISPSTYFPQARTLDISRKIRVTVSFSPRGTSGADPAFEPVLQSTLLNYATAKNFRIRTGLAKARALPGDSPFLYDKVVKLRIKSRDEFSTETQGLYAIPASSVENWGMRLSGVDIDDIRMFAPRFFVLNRECTDSTEANALAEIPIAIIDRNTNGLFDNTDEIRFFGQGGSRFYPNDTSFTFQNNPFDSANYYWLVLDAQTTGSPKRLSTLPAVTGAADRRVTSFTERVRRENNWTNPSNGSGHYKVFWLWRILPNPGYARPDTTLSPHLFDIAGPDGALALRTVQADKYSTRVNQALHLGVRLNSAAMARTSNEWFTFSNLNANGRDTISIGTDSSEYSDTYVDWYEVYYARKLKARNASLVFFGRPGSDSIFTYALTGFSASALCLDVSDPLNPVSIPATMSHDTLLLKRRGYARTSDSLQNRVFCVYDESGLKAIQTAEIVPPPSDNIIPRDLRSRSARFDYLVVTPAAFFEASKRLAKHRASFSGDAVKTAAVVLVEDIYNQFSGGKTDPTAIRNFLFYAKKYWGTTHALLMGNGHWDFKGYLGITTPNFIPPYESFESFENDLVASPMRRSGGGVTDEFYCGCSDSVGLVLNIGRLPAKSASDAYLMVNKIMNYETENLYDKTWKNRVILLADDDQQLTGIDIINNNTPHIGVTEYVSQLMPASMEKVKVYLQEYPVDPMSREKPECERDLMDEINKGSLAYFFVGHGSFAQLTDEKVFTINRSISRLKNYDKCGLFWAASCNVGEFDNPNDECICQKVMVIDNAGMVAAIGASRESQPSPNSSHMREFCRQIFSNSPVGAPLSLGQAMSAAKRYMHSVNRENAQLYNLLGDPAMYLYPRFAQVAVSNMARYDTLASLQHLTVSGRVNDVYSLPVDGTIAVQLIAPSDTVGITYMRTELLDSTMRVAKDGYQISSNLAAVHNNAFSVDFIVPKSIPFLRNGAKLTFFSWYQGKIAETALTNVYFSGSSGATTENSGTGPRISVYVSSKKGTGTDFTNPPAGERMVIQKNSIVTVVLEDSDGIKTSGAMVNEGVLYEFKGLFDRRRMISLNSFDNTPNKKYFNLNMETELLGITQELAGSEYEFMVMAQDNYDNRSRKTLSARFVDEKTSSLNGGEVFNYPNPFTNETRFIWQTPVESDITIKIFTQAGKLIRVLRSRAVLGPYDPLANSVWDGMDEAGAKAARGVYFYSIIYKKSETTSETSDSLSAADQKPFIGKMLKY